MALTVAQLDVIIEDLALGAIKSYTLPDGTSVQKESILVLEEYRKLLKARSDSAEGGIVTQGTVFN